MNGGTTAGRTAPTTLLVTQQQGANLIVPRPAKGDNGLLIMRITSMGRCIHLVLA